MRPICCCGTDVRATVLQFEAVAGMAFETDKKAARLVVYLPIRRRHRAKTTRAQSW